MAGDVLISNRRSWTTGSLAFRAIIGAAKKLLERGDATLTRKLFEPIQDGMDLIDLTGLGAAEFRKVYAALTLHYLMSKNAGSIGHLDAKYFEATLGQFQALLKELSSDARAKADAK
jgi:hypothetical protein